MLGLMLFIAGYGMGTREPRSIEVSPHNTIPFFETVSLVVTLGVTLILILIFILVTTPTLYKRTRGNKD